MGTFFASALLLASAVPLAVASGSDANVAYHAGSGMAYEHLFSGGGRHTCFVNASRLQCWGDCDFQNCNPPEGPFASVSSGYWHTCAIRYQDDRIICWGSGYALQASPPPEEPAIALSSGFAHSCAIRKADQTLMCWGQNVQEDDIPKGAFSSVSVGSRHTCAVRAVDSVPVCWGGDGEWGQLEAPTNRRLASISCGGGHCCGLDTEGRAVCWGGSDRYRGGVQQPSIGPFKQVTVGEDHSCALEESGLVQCWGKASGGVVDPPPGVKYSLLAAGASHTCGIHRGNGGVDCWGEVPPSDGTDISSGLLITPPTGAQAGSGEYTIDAGVKYAGEVASTGANMFSSLFRKLSSMVGSEEEGSSEAKKDL